MAIVLAKKDLVPGDFFESLPFWSDLNREERSALQRETRGLAETHAGEAVMRYHRAQHLQNIQIILKGKQRFTAYLKKLRYSYRTAYRYIEALKEVQQKVPENVLQMAAARGYDLVGYTGSKPFGPYTEPIKQLPPPKRAEDIPGWLDDIEAKRKELPKKRKHGASSEERMRAVFRMAAAWFNSLPVGKQRVRDSKRLIGMLLVEFHLPAGAAEPEAAPDGFKAVAGRPRIVKSA